MAVRSDFDFLAADGVIDVQSEFDSLLADLRDVPSIPPVLRRLADRLRTVRLQTSGLSWRIISQAFRGHELARVLRTDPMVRRCQWRQPDASVYAIVEAFVMGWDDANDCLLEAEEPGHALNTAFLNLGLGAALRERRNTLHSLIARTARSAYRCSVLGLGAGRAPEVDVLTPGDPLPIHSWLTVDEAARDEPSRRRGTPDAVRRVVARPADWLAAGTDERFDVIYAVDALDLLDDGQAVAFLEKAIDLLRPNGRMVLSALVPDLPESGYLDAVLDWRPNLRDGSELERLVDAAAPGHRIARTSWRGATDRVAFILVERNAWAD